MNDLPEDFLAHFPPKICDAMCDFARDTAFVWSRYIFTRRVGKHQYGYCTHCGKEFETFGLRHGEKTTCPYCESTCMVKASGRGRKNLVDEAYFVWYDKSVKNPNAIVAYGIWAIRDYRENFFQVETKFVPVAAYLFEPDNARMFKRHFGFGYYFRTNWDEVYVGKWTETSTVYSLFATSPMQGKLGHIDQSYSRESILEAVKGTPFRWSGWEKYSYDDMIKFFALFVKYPCIEYFTKLAFYPLVEEKLLGYATHGAINWRGKTLFKILKINKQEINAIKARSAHVTYDFLAALQMLKKVDSDFMPDEAVEVADILGTYHLQELQKLSAYGGIKKILRYLKKQHQKLSKHFPTIAAALTAWRDYLGECKKLEANLEEANMLFPSNLHEAHQKTLRLIKMKADEVLNKQIALRLKSLEKKYLLEFGGLFIRPATSSIELFDEGKALDHCVGGYAERYARGETDILLIRKTEEPDKPFYTVEVVGNKIRQVRGFKNCSPTDEVQWFVEEFTNEKLTKKRHKSKERVAIPA